METRNLRPTTLFATAAAVFCLFAAGPALSLTFTVPYPFMLVASVVYTPLFTVACVILLYPQLSPIVFWLSNTP